MKTLTLDVRGHACPVPSLKMTKSVMKKEVEPGDILEVLADCPTFEADVKAWCAAMHKVLLFMRDEPQNVKRCQVKI
jgi:TusA-related sulfurtransferase